MKRMTCLLGLLLLAAAGCVERRMTVMSEPAGATVYLDGDEIGTTPVTTTFLFYGGRQLRLEKTDYETQIHVEEIKAPFYQWFPIDLVSDVLIPWTIVDRRYFPYKLEPAEPVDKVALVERAKKFRDDSARPIDCCP